VVHAEVNAILNKGSKDVKGATLYVALFPCNDCAKIIIQAGIREVVDLSDLVRVPCIFCGLGVWMFLETDFLLPPCCHIHTSIMILINAEPAGSCSTCLELNSGGIGHLRANFRFI